MMYYKNGINLNLKILTPLDVLIIDMYRYAEGWNLSKFGT